MRDATPHILLTGFGPFPGVERNISGVFARRLAALSQRNFEGFHFVSASLPVSWRAAPDMLSRLLAQYEPALALHFGVSEAARGFVLETVGRNTMQPCLDCEGQLPKTPHVISGCVPQLATTLPVREVADALERETIPVQISDDAGGYLCNAVLFHSLAVAAGHAGPETPHGHTAGFVHIPVDIPDEATCRTETPLDWPLALRGGQLILKSAIAALPKAKRTLRVRGA